VLVGDLGQLRQGLGASLGDRGQRIGLLGGDAGQPGLLALAEGCATDLLDLLGRIEPLRPRRRDGHAAVGAEDGIESELLAGRLRHQ
jgi:hypothetical protein